MSSTNLHRELLRFHLFEDIEKELHAAGGKSEHGYFGKAEGFGLVFAFWRERHPDLLATVTDDEIGKRWRWMQESPRFGDDEDLAPPPFDAEALRSAPLIPCEGINVLLRSHPVISRSLFRSEYGGSPFSQRGGIELGTTGWLQILEPVFDWLESEAVGRKEIGFPDSELPRLSQVKEKIGVLRVYASTPSSLRPEFEQRMEAAEELAAKTCMRCGAPGSMRRGGWLHVYCDACETAFVAERSAR